MGARKYLIYMIPEAMIGDCLKSDKFSHVKLS